MNGSIHLNSIQGKGSQFIVKIDNVEFILAKKQVSKIIQPAQRVVFEKSVILIVDDVVSNIKIIAGLLNSPNLTLLEAESAESALEILQSNNPDMILMDIRMPGLDGYELTRIIRDTYLDRKFHVIAVTASVFDATYQGFWFI